MAGLNFSPTAIAEYAPFYVSEKTVEVAGGEIVSTASYSAATQAGIASAAVGVAVINIAVQGYRYH